MEIRKKKISLAGLFGRYIFMFVTGTFFAALISGVVMFFLILIPSGPFLPANYAEQQLINTKETLQEADITEEEMIPSGSLYGVFDREGSFLYGTFDEEVQKDAAKDVWKGVAKAKNILKFRLPQNFLIWGMT